ncbi:hypothetical protein [Helicobacter apodemus]|uniref:Uncharacterized protein n=1 Tax=Helicobacter apodemus TaxID=135569 RepID=A0A2U8FAS6_9HELI|nr:hypothetical protein [Helicobacter apodemus]AWI33333.1 hypothetical protein CDV25_00125 [Helicobacter apodemus]
MIATNLQTNGAIGLIPGMVIGGAASSLGVSALRLEKYHSFESYFNNPEFQLQQTIQRLLMQDAMKEVKEKGLGDDKE